MEQDRFDLRPWADNDLLTSVEKVRLALNLQVYQEYVDNILVCLLEEQNLYFDQNLIPRMLYRGVQHVMQPTVFTAEAFFKQYQALVLTLLYPQYSFHDYYYGATEFFKLDALGLNLSGAGDVNELITVLQEAYTYEGNKYQQVKVLSKLNYYVLLGVIVFMLVVLTSVCVLSFL